MQVTDAIADMLTRIRNANSAKHDSVKIPASNMKKAIAQILVDEGYIIFYLAQNFAREQEIIQLLVVGIEYLALVAFPAEFAVGKEQYVVTYVHHRVHVVGVHYGGDPILLGNAVYQFVYNE